MTEWKFDYLLPNLVLGEVELTDASPQPGEWPSGINLGSEFIALVPHGDARLLPIRSESAQVAKLLDSFRTLAGHKHLPAVILVRRDAPEAVHRDMECLIAFRNAVAFTFLLRARAADARGTGKAEPTWSDTFELHPTIVGPKGHLVTQSEALLAVFSPDAKYIGTHSPHLSPCGRRLYPDVYVYRALSAMWQRRYIEGDKTLFTTAIFRALEVAFLASSLTTKNQGSVSEYGTQLSLWVSALEILAWPQGQHADLPAVLALLGKFEWASEALSEKSQLLQYKGASLQVNTIQYAYLLMYRARNEFLHGNPVSADTLIPSGLSGTLSLPRVASTVFRTALVAYLLDAVPPAPIEDGELGSEMINDYEYSKALRISFGLERKTPDGG